MWLFLLCITLVTGCFTDHFDPGTVLWDLKDELRGCCFMLTWLIQVYKRSKKGHSVRDELGGQLLLRRRGY